MGTAIALSQRYSIEGHAPESDRAEFAAEVKAGLTAPHKYLPCRFLYDRRGSRLFESICALPEYYIPRAESELLARRSPRIANAFEEPATLIELGSGSAEKTRLLIEALLAAQGTLRYVPVDISRAALEESATHLLADYDDVSISALNCDWTEGLERARSMCDGPKLIAWLGSNIGNLTREEAADFLATIAGDMRREDRLLVGIDLRKDRATLERAYNDSHGVTAAFIGNILRRANRELGAHFDARRFRYDAHYSDAAGRVEMREVSLERQRVRIDALDLDVEFDAGESIHIENSHKYSPAEIRALVSRGGLAVDTQWIQSEGLFSLNLFRKT